MSAFSVSRFYAADDVDSAFTQNIESLFNRFKALQACKTGWPRRQSPCERIPTRD